MGCGPEIACAEPARKHDPIGVRTPTMERVRELDKAEPRRGTDEVLHESDEDKLRRGDLIAQFAMIAEAGFTAFELAVKRVDVALTVPEKAKEAPDWVTLVDIAIGAVLAGTAGSIGQYVSQSIMKTITKKFVADAVKDVISKVLKPKGRSSPASRTDLKKAFMRPLEERLLSTETDFALEWPSIAPSLRQLSLDELQRFNAEDLAKTNVELVDTIERHILVGWTNFLARAVHGGMGPWDPWQRHGRDNPSTITGQAIPLRGAAKNPYDTPEAKRVDPMLNNVEPTNMHWAIDDDQRPMEGEHVGILEIHLWTDGALNVAPQYGMRLDHVGPAVRDAFKQSGKTVRDLAVNKIVRVSNLGPSQLNPPLADGAFLITADGHIRLTSWPFRKEALVPTAERAQDLPLSYLEVG